MSDYTTGLCKDGSVCRDCGACSEACTKRIAFLQGLPAENQRQILKKAVHEQHKKGSYLFHAGSPVDAIYMLRTGQVKLSAFDGDGGEKTAGIFVEGDMIWEGLFLDNSTYPYSAVCLTVASVCKIYRTDFEEAICDPAVARRVIHMLSVKLHDANERNLLLSTNDPKARIAGFLLYQKRRTTEPYVTLRLGDIAAAVKLRPETVSRKLRELEQEGLIRREGQSSTVLLDFARLRELADG